ncbi:branched-chain amino acid ABC transporter permease [Pelagibius marinus]|uniref:branched-chain amino acid ABC transporter permease n=1 Tax=Pelagibius marinus TaxID=2762760 RepID=UPI001872E80C|nr:branched-chain amino acid ABC transporter permease [Pelagibius marinus]
MDLLSFVNFYLVPGIVAGAIYALGAIGVTLVFGVLRFAHLAHGDLATFGAFLVLALVGAGMTPWLALPLAMAAAALTAIALHHLFYAHLSRRSAILTVISSLGVALMLRAVVQMIWGVDTESYVSGIDRPQSYLGIRLKDRELWTLLATAGLVVGLLVFLGRTRWGKALRAMSDNPDLAALSGIDKRLTTALTWGLAGLLTAAAGFFLGLNTEVKPLMGWHMLLPVFAAAILGGVGRVEGALLGGLLIGIVEECSVLLLPAQYKSAVAFAVLLVMLSARPSGLLRGKVL